MKASVRLLVENGHQYQLKRPLRHVALVAFLVSVAAAVPACSSSDAAEETDGGDTFTAYNSNFQDFHSWSSFTFEGAAIPDSPHATAGARIEYINQVPPQGATKFPVGTIIVKEMSAGAVPTRVTFAMVKVGGGFNPEGAVDGPGTSSRTTRMGASRSCGARTRSRPRAIRTRTRRSRAISATRMRRGTTTCSRGRSTSRDSSPERRSTAASSMTPGQAGRPRSMRRGTERPNEEDWLSRGDRVRDADVGVVARESSLPFTYNYETLGEGEGEIEQYVDMTPVRAHNEVGKEVTYAAMQYQTEFEYGIADRLELGLYVALQPKPDYVWNAATLTEGTGNVLDYMSRARQCVPNKFGVCDRGKAV